MTKTTCSLLPISRRSTTRIGALLGATIFVGAAASGCGLDTTITLGTQTIAKDFGSASGTVTAVACSAATDPCAAAASQVAPSLASSGAMVTGVCDTTAKSCTAQINATLSYPIDLSSDAQYTSGVGGKAVSLVHSITLNYGIPTNTLTFAIPQLDLYIAPTGVTSVTDPNALHIDKIPTIGAKQVIADFGGHITVNTSTPAGQKFVYYIQHPTEKFVLLANGQPVVKAGDALPAGQVKVDIQPQISIGLPGI